MTKVKLFVEVAEGEPADFAARYDDLVAKGDGAPLGIERSGDDLLFIYTGGTTGMPKGVMWPHQDLREISLLALRKLGPVPETMEQLVAATKAFGRGPRSLPAPPLMHGTGLLTGLGAHIAGGCVITLEKASFDAVEMLEAIDKHKPQSLTLVGDAL